MKKLIIGLILVMLLVPVSCAAPVPETVVFPDEKLDAVIRDALDKPEGGYNSSGTGRAYGAARP